MAEYGLFCAKLRREGFDVVADLIEKLQAERDAAEQERDKLRLERDALLGGYQRWKCFLQHMCAQI